MTNLPVAANVAQIASLAFPIFAGGWGLWRGLEKRQAKAELAQQHIADKLDFIEGQFGPNGGGLRQAVNEMSHKIDKIENRVNSMSQDLAEVSGRFDQHIIEGD
jgi:hypothetical protein